YNQMSGSTPDVHHAAKAAQVKCRHNTRRAEHTKAVHTAYKGSHALFRLEEVIENRAVAIELLPPAVRPFPHGVLKARPEQIQYTVGVEDVSAERMLALEPEVSIGQRLVGIAAIVLAQQAEGGARIEEALQRSFVRADSLGQLRCVLRF